MDKTADRSWREQVATVIVDGSIATERRNEGDPDKQLFPEAIAEASAVSHFAVGILLNGHRTYFRRMNSLHVSIGAHILGSWTFGLRTKSGSDSRLMTLFARNPSAP